MMSRIEQLISEIEEYIDSCKFQALSNSKIIVNKEELEELLVELRLRIPDEIKKYQKIISQQETILGEAQSQADAMLEDAKKQADNMVAQASEQADSMVAQASEQTTEMINEHEIMQRAYAHANEVVEQANIQAQAIVDSAVNDANNIRQGAIQYTDDMLRSLQTIINHTMEGAKGRFDSFMSSMQSSYDIVSSNRSELAGGLAQPEEQPGNTPEEGQPDNQ
ncbi:MAG: vacuolar family H+-ATPase subunit H [Enterocloster sp.]